MVRSETVVSVLSFPEQKKTNVKIDDYDAFADAHGWYGNC